MKSTDNHTDDFIKLFDQHQLPDLPINLEEKIMARIDVQMPSAKRRAPQWLTTNFVVFSLSFLALSLLAVFQFMTDFNFSFLSDFKIIATLSTGIFFILWLSETADGLLQHQFQKT